MATYAELQAQIAQLQREAQAVLSEERLRVISDVRGKIAQFGLTARDLGLEGGMPGASKRRGKAGGAPRYRGPEGQLWSGFGRQPDWLRAALASGRSKDDFLIAASA